jgi:hypothetical protein
MSISWQPKSHIQLLILDWKPFTKDQLKKVDNMIVGSLVKYIDSSYDNSIWIVIELRPFIKDISNVPFASVRLKHMSNGPNGSIDIFNIWPKRREVHWVSVKKIKAIA